MHLPTEKKMVEETAGVWAVVFLILFALLEMFLVAARGWNILF